ncbi:multicomponent Na+:H+ antiporter subunit D [Pararhizobium capsulatum DSM 1112]|uniref:Multicomponent Na+:H+ antiporter subunit D n=1 Tax=Pararhizobium capsulatum DSM 1112 TaxID=1121113 RepID=A0ABU0BMT6_9HYPH|nr:Na+/H+ antiporter subunit D [Pararhizobium capsulatum]MDQ0319572.1 multicomponent Na+:H+ antiporter subunit D [Pararhizobium capsulatum DSM 1112]
MASPASPIDLSLAVVTEAPDAADWLVVLPVALCIGTGALLTMLRSRPALQGIIALATLGILVLVNAGLIAHVSASGPVTMMMGRWLPPFGIAFTVDMMGALFSLTASVVAFACALYSLGDINEKGRRHGFYPFLLLLMAGVSGAFLAGDIFNLYVWFEVLLISSFGLLVIGSEHRQIDGAVKYGFLNLVATTLFLIATGYLYGIFGTLNMADIVRKVPTLPDSAPLMTLVALYLFAFGMKAAAFPVNFWLPASYHTPRIVVSALFAGLLTKVGVYALLRTGVMLFPAERESLSTVIAVVAAFTMLTGALGALAQADMRRLLGYLVISGIGAMLVGLSLSGADGVAGTIVYGVHSMLVMSALYLAIGLSGRHAGSFAIAEAGGLWQRHLPLSALTLILFFSVSGLPPFSGFWPKLMLVKAALAQGAGWLAAALLVSGFLTTIATGRFFLIAYWRPTGERAVGTGETVSPAALLPVAALTLASILVGLYPEPLIAAAKTAAEGLTAPSTYIQSVFGAEVKP